MNLLTNGVILKELFQVNITPVLITLFLLIFVLTNSLTDKRLNMQFLITITLFSLLVIVDSIEYYLSSLSYPTIGRIIMSILGYTLRPIIIMNVILLVHQFKPKKLILYFIPCMLVFIISSTALFSDISFSYDEANKFVRGPLGLVPHIVSIFYLVLTFYFSFTMYKEKSILENVIVLALIFSIIISIIVEMIFKIEGVLNMSIIISIAFYYLYINVQAYKRDTLTGALNRHSFFLDSKKIGKSLITIISLDVNDLKIINDSLGHLEGDALLCNITHIISKNLRGGSRLYRIGGDEFVILITKRMATFEAEEMYNSINTDLLKNNYSCAIGIAYVYDENESFKSLLKKADELMYEDKIQKKRRNS